MKSIERPRRGAPMSDAQRQQRFGYLRPMPQPSWWQRLRERIGL